MAYINGNEIAFSAQLNQVNINAMQTYLTSVDSEPDTAPETIDSSESYAARAAAMYEGQRAPVAGDFLLLQFDTANSMGQDLIMCMITSVEEDNTALDPFVYMKPLYFVQGKNGAVAEGGAILDEANQFTNGGNSFKEKVTVTDANEGGYYTEYGQGYIMNEPGGANAMLYFPEEVDTRNGVIATQEYVTAKTGTLTALDTTEKATLVAAINELHARLTALEAQNATS